MKRGHKILAATLTLVMLSASSALAGGHHGNGVGAAGQKSYHNNTSKNGAKCAPDTGWLDKAPQSVKDAFKQMDIKRGEMRLEVAKGDINAARMRAMFNDMQKARRAVSDYCFNLALTKTGGVNMFHDSGGRGSGMHTRLLFDLRGELGKDKPDVARARKIYTEVMNLSDKQAKESFELCLKYPESFADRTRSHK